MTTVLAFKPRAQAPQRFYVHMPDDSLSGVNIYAEDYLEARAATDFSPGDLVVVSLPPPGTVFVKFIYPERGGRYRLEGAHPDCPIRIYTSAEVAVMGVIV